jgi:hypothetical protein
MAGRSLVKDAAVDLAGKALVWGPAIAGTIALGPAGAVLGFAASVAIVASAGGSSPPEGDQGSRGRNAPSK